MRTYPPLKKKPPGHLLCSRVKIKRKKNKEWGKKREIYFREGHYMFALFTENFEGGQNRFGRTSSQNADYYKVLLSVAMGIIISSGFPFLRILV